MSDHISGPRAIADPVIDITDVYAFPCPESSRHLIVIMNVFPYAGRPPSFPMRSFTGCGCVRFRLRPMDAPLLSQPTNPLSTAPLAARKPQEVPLHAAKWRRHHISCE